MSDLTGYTSIIYHTIYARKSLPNRPHILFYIDFSYLKFLLNIYNILGYVINTNYSINPPFFRITSLNLGGKASTEARKVSWGILLNLLANISSGIQYKRERDLAQALISNIEQIE